MKSKFIFNSILLIAFILFIPSVSAGSFGVSPPWIINNYVKPGSVIEYKFDLSTSDASVDMIVTAKITGDTNIAKWLTIKNQKNLTMPKGEKHVYMYVTLNVPKDAKVGKYNGNIIINLKPKIVTKGSVAINLGGNIKVQLGVSDYDVKDYKVKSVVFDSITQDKNFNLKLKIENTGNVPVSDVTANVSIKNDKTGKVIAAGSANKLSAAISPNKTDEAILAIPLKNKINVGKYWADTDVLKDGKSVYKSNIYFVVNPPDIVKAAGKGAVKTTVRVKNPMENVIVGSLAFVFGCIVIIGSELVRRKKK